MGWLVGGAQYDWLWATRGGQAGVSMGFGMDVLLLEVFVARRWPSGIATRGMMRSWDRVAAAAGWKWLQGWLVRSNKAKNAWAPGTFQCSLQIEVDWEKWILILIVDVDVDRCGLDDRMDNVWSCD